MMLKNLDGDLLGGNHMEWKIIPTGIKELDAMLGGGILDDSVVLVVYDTNSFGWVLAAEVFRSLVERNGFGIITNYSLPYSLLSKYAGVPGIDLDEAGLEGKLAIVDVFGAMYGIKLDRPHLYYLPHVDASTFLPKIVEVYYRILQTTGNRKPIGLTVGLDGFAHIFDEETVIRLLRRNMMLKEKAKATENRERPITIMLLNRDRVSRAFISWVSHYSEHILEFEPTSRPGVERIIARKSLLPDFGPSEAEFFYSRGKMRIRLPER